MAKTKEKEGKKAKGGSADWEKDLAKEASKERAREKGGGGGGLSNRISTDKKRFTFDGENLGRTIKVVVIDFVYLNTLYKAKYTENEPNIPRCFAVDGEEDDISPHENVGEPINDTCEGCPKNEWGSGRGRAKACQQRRRLALIHEDDLEDIEEAKVAFLEIAPTSVKNWSKFVKECSDKLLRPYYTVKAELSFDEDEDYPVVEFKVDEKIKDKELIDGIKEKRETIRDELMTAWETTASSEDDDDDDKPKGKKPKDKKDKKGKKPKVKKDDDDDEEEEEDEDEDDEDEGDEDEDDKPKGKKSKSKSKSSEEDEEDDEEDDEDDDEDDEDDDEDDEKPAKRKRGKGGAGVKGKRGKPADDSDDDEDEDDDEEDEEDEDEDEDDEDEKPKGKKGKLKSKKGSRFSK